MCAQDAATTLTYLKTLALTQPQSINAPITLPTTLVLPAALAISCLTAPLVLNRRLKTAILTLLRMPVLHAIQIMTITDFKLQME